MPILYPEKPRFANSSESLVWGTLAAQLGPDDALICGLRISDRDKDHEIDMAVVLAGAGVVVVEVKGSSARYEDGTWRIDRHGRTVDIDPIGQARGAMYALRSWISNHEVWGSRGHLRWGHAAVFPYTDVAPDFETPDARSWQLAGRADLDGLVAQLRRLVLDQTNDKRLIDADDVVAFVETLGARAAAQRDVIGRADEREHEVERLSEQQAVILDAITLLHRVEVRGGAGSGKTWLAVEQARRLTRNGKRVALACYSRGLAAWMRRRVDGLDRHERPAYVGTFHNLGVHWGAESGTDDDSDFWERRLPEQMVDLAGALPSGQRFDAIVIDEAQDFADLWWPAALAALRDDDGGVYVFSDEGQRVFSRFGGPPPGLVPLVLDHNLRNTRQIAETFSGLAPIRMRPGDVDGPEVRLVACAPDRAMDAADDAVDGLLDDGWRPRDVALLATGSRHPEQVGRQAEGQDAYWASFWDDDQVFYGHVLGFKGLERAAVVLAINEAGDRDRFRERLYVGLSRARDLLVICGDPAVVQEVCGPSVLRRFVHSDGHPGTAVGGDA